MADYSAIFGALGNLASTGIQGAFGATNSKRAYHFQRNLINLQNDLNRQNQIWTYANGPSQARAGFESAGYNPILALGNLSNSSPQVGTGSASMAPTPDSDLTGSASNAYQAFKLAREKNNAEVNATNASASLASEQAKTESFRRDLMTSENLLNNINYELKSKELSWYDRRSLQELKSMAIGSQAQMLGARAQMSQAHTAKMVGQASSDYNRSLRDLNTLEYHIKSPRARATVNRPEFVNNGFEHWNYLSRSILGRN